MSHAPSPLVVFRASPRCIVGRGEYFGLGTVDLVGPPRRLYADDVVAPPLFEPGIDALAVDPVPSPADLVGALPSGDSWLAQSSRTLERLMALYLIAEDPQERLVARKAATLAHQTSLVHHLFSTDVRRVLIADEVGLGKTIEAGLIIAGLLAQNPGLRVLYLAPARLVANVHREFRDKLALQFRRWAADDTADAYLPTDNLVVASIHRAVHPANRTALVTVGPWDLIVVDECHHLSARGPGGTDANQHFALVRALLDRLSDTGRLLLMSGTPHQGSRDRFENLVSLLLQSGESRAQIAGRVVFRTKEDVRDWNGRPLFPGRRVAPARVVQLGEQYRRWYDAIAALYDGARGSGAQARAAGWAKGQALQWAASSVHAGLGFLCRLGIRRLDWTSEDRSLRAALAAIRPYKGGASDEPIDALYAKMRAEVQRQLRQLDVEDMEEMEEEPWRPDGVLLRDLLNQGVALLASPVASAKWTALLEILAEYPHEKAVLFAQPVETVTALAQFLTARFGVAPAIILGGQSDFERERQIQAFRKPDGPQYLVSSRAGGEGINLQVARRLVHLDVPWNPMELEQRVGRVHRFGSLKTILVDTLVVEDTREVDAYRVAREKLQVAFADLVQEPERFEALFSRVMSLIPPQQFEELLGSAPAGPITAATRDALGELVEQGLRSWRAFDKEFAGQRAAIAGLNPGTATWEDLEAYLRDSAGAAPVGGWTVTAFQEQGGEIIATLAPVPALQLGGEVFARTDSAGLPARDSAGVEAASLGLNSPAVVACLRKSALPALPTGGAWLRPRDGGVSAFDGGLPGGLTRPFGVLGFLRQQIRIESGNPVERGIELRVVVLDTSGKATELAQEDRATLVRLFVSTSRVQNPDTTTGWPKTLGDAEAQLALAMERPSPEQFRGGIRFAVWPILAAVVL